MMALIVSLPLGPFEVGMFSLPDVLVLVTVVVLGLDALRRGALQRTTASIGAVVAITALLGWMAGSIAATGASVRELTQPIGHWLLLCAVVLYVDNHRDAERVLLAGAVAAAGIAVLTLLATVVQLPMEPRTLRPRTFGPIRMPVGRVYPLPLSFGILGMFLLYPAPYLAVRGWQERSRIALGGAGAVVLAVVITQSRSTYLALAAAVGILALAGVCWTLVHGPTHWRRRMGFGALVGGTVSLPIALLGARTLIRAGRRTFVARLGQVREGVLLMLDRPLFGTGPGQFREVVEIRHVIHTAWVRLGAESGVPALALFLVAVYVGVRQLVRTATQTERATLAIVLLAGGTAVAIEASFQGSFGRPTWVVLGLAVTAPWRQLEESNQTR